MDRLWAPWRVKYITNLHKKQKGCIFCKMSQEKKDKDNYIFKRSQHAFAVLNIFPYNNGHILIVPYRHADDLSKLTRMERENLLDLLSDTKKLVDNALHPGGYNIGLNLGRVAGAGFPGHLHVHLVPRWGGDVNFMPTIASTKIISQSLRTLFEKLSHANKKSH